MHNDLTSSLELDCHKRLDKLYRESHVWLNQVAYNICKSREEAEELVSDLYVYLGKKCRPKIFYNNSYNLIYCMKFIKHRWFNKVAKLKRYQYTGDLIDFETEYSEYDIDKDMEIMRAHEEVLNELNRLRTTKMWTKAKIYELYWMGDKTLDQLAKDIGISKSTTFLSIKYIKAHMKKIIDSPF